MGHGLSNIRHTSDSSQTNARPKEARLEDFVLEKSIFNNVFEKDIRRVFIYKKAERLAKAIHLIAPAFVESASLRSRIDAVAVGLIDAAVLPSGSARTALSRELLALSSMLSIARIGGMLSLMNAELITREAHSLLHEIAGYEEPRLFMDEAPTLSDIAKNAVGREDHQGSLARTQKRVAHQGSAGVSKRQENIKDTGKIKDRQETILSIVKDKKKASIKDISTLIRGVSEKTIQRELLALIEAGRLIKEGERRWSTYSLA